MRDPKFAVRREDAERDARGGARRVPQDGRAQGDPDQHQVRRRRAEPHDGQSRHQVRGGLPPSPRPSSIETFLLIIYTHHFVAWISRGTLRPSRRRMIVYIV